MQLCDFCGFVLNEGDAKCSNCSAQIPGREHLAIQTQEPKTKKKNTKSYITEVVTWGVNKAKWKAAKEFCKDRGWQFMLITEKELKV